MAAYTYSPAPVLVETTGEFAIGASGVFRATEGGDPVAVYDLNDSPIASVVVGPKGAHQAFKADIPNGVLDFGSVLLPTASLEQQEAALNAETIALQAQATADSAAASATTAATAAAAAEASAAEAAAQAQAVPDAVQDIVALQVVDGTGLSKALGVGNDTLTLSVDYGNTAGTAVEGNDVRVLGEQDPGVASIRSLGTEPWQAAPGVHTHTAAQITDSSAVGRTVLTAATAADARAALDAANRARTRAEVTWEENGPGTKWGTVRPTGYKRVEFNANGVTGTEDPSLTIAQAGDIWERPA